MLKQQNIESTPGFSERQLFIFNSEMAKRFDTRAEFATARSLEGQMQGDLHNLCKNRLFKCIVIQ